MNAAGDEGDRPMDSDDHLDAVLDAWRSQRVPPLPAAATAKHDSPSVGVTARHYAIAAGVALAASVILWTVLHFRSLPPAPIDSPSGQFIADTNVVSSPIVEFTNGLSEPLHDLATRLDQLEQELNELEISASLLDVLNEADRLVADFAPLKDTL